MMHSRTSEQAKPIPVLLLKTRSQPDDSYEEYFSDQTVQPQNAAHGFTPHFIPVLEHKQNTATLNELEVSLRDGTLRQKYGGMIFTSQRAVEAWADVVIHVEDESDAESARSSQDNDPFANMLDLLQFPLYTVGPATSRALSTLVSRPVNKNCSPFLRLNPSIHGMHTGNGASLASFILSHYNDLHRQMFYEYFEAPRLPFIPLLGMSSQNYGRKRLERDDARLLKKPLLFLVGETRRDVIPKTCMNPSLAEQRVRIEEVEVYSTTVMQSFAQEFHSLNMHLDKQQTASDGPEWRIVVVFSPQGCDVMLKEVGLIDNTGRKLDTPRSWPGVRFMIVSIGPTTRDYLLDEFGIEADVCAAKPSPEGVKSGILDFLQKHSST